MSEEKKAEEKKSAGSKVWGAVGTVIVVGIGIIVLLMILGAIFPMIIGALNSFVGMLTAALMQLGVMFHALGNGIRVGMGGLFSATIVLLMYVLFFFAVGYAVLYLINKIKSSGNKDGGHAAH